MKKRGQSRRTAEERALEISRQKKKELRRKVYKFGFWLFFALALFSVMFSVVTISSVYRNFQVVTRILDQSFERTNLVLDITSSKIESCQQKLEECQQQDSGGAGAAPGS
ncbi:hypothetical protein ACFL3V_04235 [Nanoarchaeota archaeon]